MSYASSYAVGASQLGNHADGRHDPSVAAGTLLPAPKPTKLHWSTMLLIAGLVVSAIALLATIAGVPARMGYDVDGAAQLTKPSSSNPLAVTKTIDTNMKWIKQASSDTPTTYLGLTKSIDHNEAAIPAMMQALASMDGSVRVIERSLGEVGATTAQMRADMDAMAATSAASAKAMTALRGDIGFISSSMVTLAGSTKELTERMTSIERQAGGIARNGTAEARKTAEQLNRVLPDDVPAPVTSDGQPLASAMAQLNAGVMQ